MAEGETLTRGRARLRPAADVVLDWLSREWLEGRLLAGFSAEPLAGMTNQNYKFVLDGEPYVLRIPGNRTSDFIDRHAEAYNAEIAYNSGLGPEVVYCAPDSGLMITRFIDCATVSSAESLKRPKVLARAVAALGTLHGKGAVLARHFDPFETIGHYVETLGRRGGARPEGYPAVLQEAESIRQALKTAALAPTACHVDPYPENFLDSGEVMFLIDWEYAGNGDAFWDLAALSIECAFANEDEWRMLESYLGRPPGAAETGRVFLYKIVGDLMWTPWAMMQLINGNDAIDYWSYGIERFRRAVETIGVPEFGGHIASLRR
jgi:thiamine kinase-like enzyme